MFERDLCICTTYLYLLISGNEMRKAVSIACSGLMLSNTKQHYN